MSVVLIKNDAFVRVWYWSELLEHGEKVSAIVHSNSEERLEGAEREAVEVIQFWEVLPGEIHRRG